MSSADPAPLAPSRADLAAPEAPGDAASGDSASGEATTDGPTSGSPASGAAPGAPPSSPDTTDA